MNSVSIILLFYNHWDMTHARMLELYKFAPEFCEICLLNNASEEDCDSGVAWWQKTIAKHKLRYRKVEKNLGFGGGMNEGAKMAQGDILVFLSNDVVVSGDFVTDIVTKIENNNRKVFIGGEIVWHPAGWNEFNVEGKKVVVPWANGWLLACTRDAWNEIGGFDPRYGKADYEDVDISLTAQSLGYNLVALNSPFTRHIGAATIGYDEKRMEHTKHNREIFEQKWLNQLKELHDKLTKTY